MEKFTFLRLAKPAIQEKRGFDLGFSCLAVPFEQDSNVL